MGRLKRHFNFRLEVLVRWFFGVLVGAALIFWCSGVAYANNVAVANVDLTGQNTSAQTAKVEFDISWDNSWRNEICRDAVWIFIKYSTDSGATWNHATLDDDSSEVTNPTGYSQGTGTGLDIVVPSDKKGAFLERTSDSIMASVDTDNIQLIWDWGTDGLSASDTARIEVFAVEMVYIPEGTLYLNTAASANMGNEIFDDTAYSGAVTSITSEDALAEGKIRWKKDNTWGGQGNDNGTSYGSDALIAAYPKGFAPFYLMKYEVSQSQYRDFLNTLTRTQQDTRTGTDVSTDAITNVYVMRNLATVDKRQGIRCPASGNGTTDPITFGCDLSGNGVFNESADGMCIACNYLSWADLTAYADWAGLRPMTELEFEKACRGSQAVITDEFAWGTNTIASSAYTLENAGTSTEGIATNYSTTAGNCSYSSTDGSIVGPLRVGIFAANGSNTGRMTSGSGYYGNMELSGNVYEEVVTIADKDSGNVTTDAGLFDGTHGNGALDATGDADVSTWPGTDARGTGKRGGNRYVSVTQSRVSDRNEAGLTSAARSSTNGGRLSRTAP